jgi:HEAT repeat protein
LGLVAHPQERVRLSALEAVRNIRIPFKTSQLREILLHEPHEPIREVTAWLLTQQPDHKSIELLYNEDVMVRKGAIMGLLHDNPAQPSALKALEAMFENQQPKSQRAALDIVEKHQLTAYQHFVEKATQHPHEQVVTEAIEAAGALKNPKMTQLLVAFLADKNHWRAAAQSLAQLGEIAVETLRNYPKNDQTPAFQRRMVAVCAQMQTEGAYGLLSQMATEGEVSVKTLALRALRNFPPTFRKGKVFEALLTDELQLAQRLLHAQNEALEADFRNSLAYEQEATLQRIFGVLMQLYDQEAIANTQISVLHSSKERRANSLELLENIVPRQVYGSLHALLDNVPDGEKIRQIDANLGVFAQNEPIKNYIFKHGTRYFTDWTIRLALRGVPPETLFQYPDLHIMSHVTASATVSITERVMVLKNTNLFAETPENVLSSIAPIMREVGFEEGQTIFKKSDLGSSMFVIYDGEIGIYDGQTLLATFGRGDVFGELALLDAEPRSAAAVVLSDAQLFRIDQNDFYDLMDERGEVMRNIIKMLCQRIRQQNVRLVAK